MRDLRDLTLAPYSVRPDSSVGEALEIMARNDLTAVPVVHGITLKGQVSLRKALRQQPDDVVTTVLDECETILELETGIRAAGLMLTRSGVHQAFVVHEGAYLGTLTALQLVGALAKSWDGLTGLMGSDRLREWGIEQFRANREISLIFVDLDDFGTINKAFGHVFGDRVLKTVAHALEALTRPESDVVVRYGGDEFAIGTTRLWESADETARRIEALENDPEFCVGGIEIALSVGMSGGRRTIRRSNEHYAAMLDSLINLASKDCTQRKLAKKSISSQAVVIDAKAPTLRLES